jgi:hypothetical protein
MRRESARRFDGPTQCRLRSPVYTLRPLPPGNSLLRLHRSTGLHRLAHAFKYGLIPGEISQPPQRVIEEDFSNSFHLRNELRRSEQEPLADVEGGKESLIRKVVERLCG